MRGEEHCTMCSQLETLPAAYGNIFTMDRDERCFSYSFSREGNDWPIHEASVEWKQMHGTDFHCVEVVFAIATATGLSKWVESLTEEGSLPPPKGTHMNVNHLMRAVQNGRQEKEGWERNQTWRNVAAHFHDLVVMVCYIYSVCEWGAGERGGGGAWMKQKQ